MIRPADIEAARRAYPGAPVLVHPECHMSVCDMADYVGSTTGIMSYAKKNNYKTYIIATEQGVTDRLKRDCPDKEFIPVKENIICPNMKMTSLEDIYNSLINEVNEITVEPAIARKAVKCIDAMLEVSK